jgi:hypothetical protein
MATKTTFVGGRSYNYGLAMDTSCNYHYGTYMQHTARSATTIWNDTSGTLVDSGHIYHHLLNTCEGVVFDPRASIFNYDIDSAYLGQMLIADTDAFVWDSVELFATYLYNATKTTEVDTLRLVFMIGAGGAKAGDNIFGGSSLGGGGHYSVISFLELAYDSVKNTGTGSQLANIFPGGPNYHLDVLLDNTTRNDTLPGGIWHRSIAVNAGAGVSVPAGSLCAMTITYISGDPAYLGNDTLVGAWRGWGNSKYNVWCPMVEYYASYPLGVAIPAWAPYTCPSWEPYPNDQNLGYWKWQPNYAGGWQNIFEPTWNQKNGSAPSVLQYPFIGWHAGGCPTCGKVTARKGALGLNDVIVVNNVQAYPDPAKGELNIAFDLSHTANVKVSLINMIGQVVAAKTVNNLAVSSVVFNTAALPSGIYIYTLLANGTVTTGRVAVAH